MHSKPTVLIAAPNLATCLQLERAFKQNNYHVVTTHYEAELSKQIQHCVQRACVFILHYQYYQNLAQPLTHSQPLLLLVDSASAELIDTLPNPTSDFVLSQAAPIEIVTRLEILLRRRRQAAPSNLAQPNSPITGSYQALALTGAEHALLELLAQHPNTVLSKEYLCSHGLQRTYTPGERSIDVHISRIRQKLTDALGQPSPIKSVRNRGYIYSPPHGPLNKPSHK